MRRRQALCEHYRGNVSVFSPAETGKFVAATTEKCDVSHYCLLTSYSTANPQSFLTPVRSSRDRTVLVNLGFSADPPCRLIERDSGKVLREMIRWRLLNLWINSTHVRLNADEVTGPKLLRPYQDNEQRR